MESDLAKQLGLDKLSPDAQQELAKQLDEAAFSAIERRCMPLLSRKQRKTYEKLAQADPEKGVDLLKQCIPSFLEIAHEETMRVQRETMDTHAAVMKNLGFG